MVIGSRRVLRETGRTAVLTAVGEWLTWECPETGLVIDILPEDVPVMFLPEKEVA